MLRVVAALVTARKLKCARCDVDEHARLQIAVVRQPRADAAVHRRPPRVVQLADLGVVPILGEVAGAGEALHAIGRVELDLRR